MWKTFEKVKQIYTIAEIAKLLNVAPGTVSRWNTTKNVPNSYRFDLMKLAGEEIDYSVFNPKEKGRKLAEQWRGIVSNDHKSNANGVESRL